MKTMVLLYDTSCIYEIVILNYFLNATGKEMIFVSPEGNPVMATEGYRIEKGVGLAEAKKHIDSL